MRSEELYSNILDLFLATEFDWVGYSMKLENGRIWRPLLREIFSGWLVRDERVSHRKHFPNPLPL